MSILELSPKKRELLDALLQEEGVPVSQGEEIPRRSPGAVIPLSFAQQRLWYLDQLDPNSSVYNVTLTVRLSGSLNIVALSKALNTIVCRHEVLRTTFGGVNGVPVQIIAENRQPEFKAVDLSQTAFGNREEEIMRLLTQEASRPFNLSADVMLRVVLLKLAPEEHILCVVTHHIASDAWSMRVFLRELSTLYGSFVAGNDSRLVELPIQYADFAIWQRQHVQEGLQTQLAYWRKQLENAPPSLELPVDGPRPAVQTYGGARQSLWLPQSLSDSLKTFSRSGGVTLFMVLLAAFKLLLHRYSRREDIVVGAPIAGRSRLATEGLIGFFVNALVLRTKFAGDLSFRELLRRVQESCVEAYAHQDVPFEKLVEELQPRRDSSRTPFFQVLFDMVDLPATQASFSGLKLERMGRFHITAKYDLTLFAIVTSRQVQLHLDYNADLFSRERIVEMLEQLHHLLTQIVDNPDERISRYSLVTRTAQTILPDPRIALHKTWYGAVHEIFADYARKQPEKVAVQDAHERWTYQELNKRSNQLARYLQDRGIRPGEIIAVYGHRRAALVWALLGVLKSGAAFCVIDPSHPAGRIRDYLSAAAPKALIQIAAAGAPAVETEQVLSGASLHSRIMLPSLATAQAGQFLSSYGTGNPDAAIGPDDIAYIAFTSGSTGKPKAVLGRHGPLTHFLPWLSETFTLSASDRFSMLSGLSFNLLQREIFTPLTVGATLCIPHPDEIAPGRLAEWINKQAVNIIHLTPAMGQILLRGEKIKLPSLRCAFFGGDLLKKSDVEMVRELSPELTIVVFYGATETQRAVGHFIIPAKRDKPEGRRSLTLRQVMPLGRGVPDVQLWVLSPSGQMAGVGELGEICVRSPHLANGYLGDDQLTQERFIVNPFTGITDDRVYRTGEQGRYLPNGEVDFVAREQDRVSIRGFRIELGEIETVLSRHPAVREAIIAAREDSTGDRRLVGYVVTKPDGTATASDLRGYLKEKLPDYMIPSTFIFLPQLPLSANGKVDRGALPAPGNARPGLAETFVAPRTPMEILIAESWKDILGLDRVGLYDNFFDLGGHSLLSMQAIARIREKTGVQIHPKAFVTQTVGQLAAVYEERMRLHTQVLSFTQRLWRSLRNAMFHHKNTEP